VGLVFLALMAAMPAASDDAPGAGDAVEEERTALDNVEFALDNKFYKVTIDMRLRTEVAEKKGLAQSERPPRSGLAWVRGPSPSTASLSSPKWRMSPLSARAVTGIASVPTPE
jgi:hypothetical protein